MECNAWPNCNFEHTEERKPCNFQENCLNINCTFEHFYQEEYFGVPNQTNILGVNSIIEFPPFPPVWGPW